MADYENDAGAKPVAESTLAKIQARRGDADSAIAAIQRLLEVPSGITRGDLRFDSFGIRCAKIPRFARLLAAKVQTGLNS